MVSKLNNNSSVIKNFDNRSSSLAMSAYISNEIRRDFFTNQPYAGKLSRDLSEVNFTALLLPSDLPREIISKLVNGREVIAHELRTRFKNLESVTYSKHYLIKDTEFISRFWSLQDAHVKAISKNVTNARLYNLMLFNSPASKKHFPPEMNISVEDLREIEEKAIYEICDEFYLRNGFAVELGRHQKEDIVHYHLMYPVRVLSYKYEQENAAFDFQNFRAWLSKSKITPLKKSLITRSAKVKEWEEKAKQDPSEYNQVRLANWQNKLKILTQEVEDILDIIAGLKRSGYTYSKYYKHFTQNQMDRINKTMASDSLFATHKGHVENYLDTYSATDKIKERYADILNRLLAEEGIIKPNTKLYEYSKSLRDYITISEARIWGLSDVKMKAYNAVINKPFKIDLDFFNDAFKTHKGKNAYKHRKHLIVNALKVVIKESLQRHKRRFVHHPEMVEQWSNVWINQLKNLKDKYAEFILTLIDRSIFNFNWRKVVNQNLIDDVIKQQQPIQIQANETVIIVDEEFDHIDKKEVNEVTLQELEIKPLPPLTDWESFVLEHEETLSQIAYEQQENGSIHVSLENEWYAFDLKIFKDTVRYATSANVSLEQELLDVYAMEQELINSDREEDYEVDNERELEL